MNRCLFCPCRLNVKVFTCKGSQQAYLVPLGARGVGVLRGVGGNDSPGCHAARWGWARQGWGAVMLGSLVSSPC